MILINPLKKQQLVITVNTNRRFKEIVESSLADVEESLGAAAEELGAAAVSDVVHVAA